MVAFQVNREAAPMLNQPRLLVEQQVSASGDLAGENRQPFEAADTAHRQVVEPDSLFASLVWIAPPLVLVAMLAISAI